MKSDCSMENVSKRFWDRWYGADELKRVDIVKELEVEKSTISPHAVATLLNSFFVDLVEYLESQKGIQRPIVVCLSGSTRFMDAFETAYIQETAKGKVVLTVAGDLRDRPEYDDVKSMLDKMYLHKIAMSDELLVLNVGGYIGESTKREIVHAKSLGKKIRHLEEVAKECKS